MLNHRKLGQTPKKVLALLLAILLFPTACSISKTGVSGEKGVSRDSILINESPETNASALLESSEIFSLGESEVDIFWRSSENTPASISYGIGKSDLKTITLKDQQKNHYLRLKDLKPNTTYYYRINGVKDSKFESFKTLARPGGKYLFSFAVATDPHLTNSKLDQFGALYKESYDIFNSLIDEVNKEKVDFLVVKGDISHGSDARDYQAFTRAVSRLNCRVYAVPGNHDKEQGTWGLFFRSFSPSSSPYFSLNHKKWHFIFVDSASEESDRGYFSSDELSWLEQDLKANTHTPTMVFMHQLVRKSLIPRAERFFVMNAEDFLNIIKLYPVVAVHSGHAHLNNVSSDGDTDFIVTGAVINYPVQYSVYHVYENGYVQLSHRLPTYIEKSEASKTNVSSVYSAYFGVEPSLVSGLVEGSLEDRSFMRKIE